MGRRLACSTVAGFWRCWRLSTARLQHAPVLIGRLDGLGPSASARFRCWYASHFRVASSSCPWIAWLEISAVVRIEAWPNWPGHDGQRHTAVEHLAGQRVAQQVQRPAFRLGDLQPLKEGLTMALKESGRPTSAR